MHVVCISRRVRSLVQATVCIRTHSHTYASFTREKLARVRYICLSSGFLLHLSPFAYLMLFYGPRSLSPFSKSRFSSKILSTFYPRLRTRSNGTFGMRKQPVDCLIPVAPKCRSTIYMQCSSLVALSPNICIPPIASFPNSRGILGMRFFKFLWRRKILVPTNLTRKTISLRKTRNIQT